MSMDPIFRRKLERIALVTLALATLASVVLFLRFEGRLANQKVLYYQLQTLRTSVNLFKAITKRNPLNLSDFVNAEYKFDGEDLVRRYVEFRTVGKDGALVDVFGNPYVYDSRTSWVRSSTPGYEHW